VGLKSNETHQVLAYADDVNLLGDKKIIKRDTETLINASKEVSLGVNEDKTKYMFESHHHNAGKKFGHKNSK
jgi:hypothetical protein